MGDRSGTDVLRVEILGSVRAWRGSRSVDIGPPQRQAVLAALLLARGRPVTGGRLIDDVWGEEASDKADAALRAHVSVLRRALEPDRPARTASSVIESVPSGYRIPPSAVRLDVDVFRERVREAEAMLGRGREEDATALFREALGVWEGELPLVGVPGPGADTARRVLDEERLSAWEEMLELDLAMRAPDRPVDSSLLRALARHPHREPLHALLIRSYVSQGRRAEALDAYAQARRRLRPDLGVEPGPALQALHAQLLTEDAATPTPQVTTTATAPGPVVVTSTPGPADGIVVDTELVPTVFERALAGTLPPPPLLVGRDAEVAATAEALRGAREGRQASTVLVRGQPGAGTSAVALAGAWAAAAGFPGGVAVLGREADDAAWDEATAGLDTDQACLLLADGLRSTEDGVRAVRARDTLSAAFPGPVVLLGAGSHRLPRLRGRRVEVAPLAHDASDELLRMELGDERTREDPVATWAIVELIGELPQVLVASAGSVVSRPSWPLRLWLHDFASLTGSWGTRRRMALEPFYGVHYAALDAPTAAALRAVALVPWPATVFPEIVADVLDIGPDRARTCCEQLYYRGLLESDGPGEYRIPRLLHTYAVAVGADDDPPALRAAMRERMLAAYRSRADAAPEPPEALRPAALRLIARHPDHPDALALAARFLPDELQAM